LGNLQFFQVYGEEAVLQHSFFARHSIAFCRSKSEDALMLSGKMFQEPTNDWRGTYTQNFFRN